MILRTKGQSILSNRMSQIDNGKPGTLFQFAINDIIDSFPGVTIRRNVPAFGYIGGSYKTEFVIDGYSYKLINPFGIHKGCKFSIRIECKYQGGGGSTYEKLPTSVINLNETPEKYAIMVTEGREFRKIGNKPHRVLQGCKKLNIEWQAMFHDNRVTLEIMWFDEFVQWCNDNL